MVPPVPIVSAPISISHLRLDLTAGCRDLREEILLRGGRWPLLSLSPSQPHTDMRALTIYLRCFPHRLLCLAMSLLWPTGQLWNSHFSWLFTTPENPRLRPCFLLWSVLVPDASSCSLTRAGTQATCPTGLALFFPQLSPSVLSAELPADYGPSVCSSASLS